MLRCFLFRRVNQVPVRGKVIPILHEGLLNEHIHKKTSRNLLNKIQSQNPNNLLKYNIMR